MEITPNDRLIPHAGGTIAYTLDAKGKIRRARFSYRGQSFELKSKGVVALRAEAEQKRWLHEKTLQALERWQESATGKAKEDDRG